MMDKKMEKEMSSYKMPMKMMKNGNSKMMTMSGMMTKDTSGKKKKKAKY